MIEFRESSFILNTNETSYIFGIDNLKHLEHYYYGKKIKVHSIAPIKEKFAVGTGNSEAYNKENTSYISYSRNFECSTIGKGDHRESFIELEYEDTSFVSDFLYKSHKIYDGINIIDGLPYAIDDQNAQTLEIELVDEAKKVSLFLYYTTFDKANIIARSTKLVNNSDNVIKIKRLMSVQLDMKNENYNMITFDGMWARERLKHEKNLSHGIFVNDSKTGNSSNQHNPFIIIKEKECSQNSGICYGFNLIYSGNHAEIVEVNAWGKLRVLSGINPFGFNWTLKPGESFSSPQGIMTVSYDGLNNLSHNMHNFINNHVVRGYWRNRQRPILANNWEGTYFDFTQNQIIKMAKEAAEVGIELFVLDDGWFGDRSDDTKALGDWFVNTKKLPLGIEGLAKKINELGLEFGLWFEPEMVNENSELYRKHPEWAIKIPYREPALGRNQMILDLTNYEVRAYIIERLTEIISKANISYIKWDMNRNFTDMYSNCLEGRQGELFHRYILGLYEILDNITKKFPKILFESCASGGNRFDLGMLCYMPQTWTSDNTDAYERYFIQESSSYGYPISTMGAHVSAVPNHQTLRHTPLETRFNVAAFGCLGYELDFTKLSSAEKKTIKRQIEDYKKMREVMQFGKFYRLHDGYNNEDLRWMVVSEDKKEGYLGLFQKLVKPSATNDIIYSVGLDDDKLYHVEVRVQKLGVKAFGSLINHVLPIKINGDGVINTIISQKVTIDTEVESYEAYGDMLNNAGVKISQPYTGTGYNENIRVMCDFGSRLYSFKESIDK